MIMYILYRLGCILACTLPIKASYYLACRIADMQYTIGTEERKAVIKNLQVVMRSDALPAREIDRMARDVFRNFAKYLVDFFRFSKIDDDYIKRFVKVEGLENIEAARKERKGVIILSAHMGNWELGGIVVPSLGYKLSAVVLTHKNKRINDFFTRQRVGGNLTPIEIGPSLRSCYTVLKENMFLALLGDRDFMNNGVKVKFFGQEASIPKGPAFFAHRIGSPMVPAFMIREKDDTFRLVFEKPIFPDCRQDKDKAIKDMTGQYLSILERYIRNFPTQWYAFREVWSNNI